MKFFFNCKILFVILLFANNSFAQLPKISPVLNEFKVSSEKNLIKESRYFNFTSHSSVGANLQWLGIKNLIAHLILRIHFPLHYLCLIKWYWYNDYDKNYLQHFSIMKGGKLEIWLQDEPSARGSKIPEQPNGLNNLN